MNCRLLLWPHGSTRKTNHWLARALSEFPLRLMTVTSLLQPHLGVNYSPYIVAVQTSLQPNFNYLLIDKRHYPFSWQTSYDGDSDLSSLNPFSGTFNTGLANFYNHKSTRRF